MYWRNARYSADPMDRGPQRCPEVADGVGSARRRACTVRRSRAGGGAGAGVPVAGCWAAVRIPGRFGGMLGEVARPQHAL